MRTFYHTEKNCIVDENWWFVSPLPSLDPRIQRDGYFYSMKDEEYVEYLMMKEEEERNKK